MKIEKYEKALINEVKKLGKPKATFYETCKPNCIECLVAEAKGRVDNRFGIEMSNKDFIAGIHGIVANKYDDVMLRVIANFKEE